MRDLVRLARDTAISGVQPAGHIRGPNEPILGPTVTGVQTRPKGNPNSTQVDCVHQLGQPNLLGPPTEAAGPVFGDFGSFWARPGHGHSGARSTLASGTRALSVPKVIVRRPNTIPDSVVTFFPGSGPLLL